MIDSDRIKELKIDEWIWIIFIILSAMNIFGDECEKRYCTTHIYPMKDTSHKVFTFTIFVSLLIYLYLEYQRCYHLSVAKVKHENILLWEVRCFGGFFVIISSILFLYCQVVEDAPTNPSVL